MAQETLAHNPFMLMTNPEVVLAAIERSERLGKLNRHLCRPLDRPAPAAQTPAAQARAAADAAADAAEEVDLGDDSDIAD